MPMEGAGITPPMPTIPAMPSINAGAGAKLPVKSTVRNDVDLDLNMFRDPAFNPDQCMLFNVNLISGISKTEY